MDKYIVTEEVIPPDYISEYSIPRYLTSGQARHIFIFLDGTWNEERTSHGKATPTNVLRMFQEINKNISNESLPFIENDPIIISYYYRGVGSRQDNNVVSRLWFGFNGKDEERIRSAAFADIYRNYKNENDRIYILGFSRGAASARLLARDICIKGLPPKLRVHTTHFPNLLTGQVEARVDHIERFNDCHETNYKPTISFLGCWDTVDAFILPSRFPKHGKLNKIKDKTVRTIKSVLPRLLGKERFSENENRIPDKVLKAVHCVAIDETRNAFLPTLMPYASHVEEVWFPGVHSDIGGGYDDNMLSSAPYEFMQNRLISAFGIGKYDLFNNKEYYDQPSEFCFHFHGLNTGWEHAKDIFGFGTAIRKIRILDAPIERHYPKIHNSIYDISTSQNVFAADMQNKRTWTITYDPYNVRELKNRFSSPWINTL